MARKKITVRGIEIFLEILSATCLISTDIFVHTQFGDTYKWKIENRDPRNITEFLTLIANPESQV